MGLGTYILKEHEKCSKNSRKKKESNTRFNNDKWANLFVQKESEMPREKLFIV
jgi:hypothetical protein